MNRPHRSIEIFTMSALDLFVTAMGSFAILMMILFPYFKNDRKKRAEEQQGSVLFCVWDTRVQDYEQFMKDTERDKYPKRESKQMEYLWQHPGYEQQPTFPVVSITWEDAQAFCQWLTRKERAAGLIGPEDEYRLPTVAEWKRAAGPGKYPWGDMWPPPAKTGNFAGEEYSRGRGYDGAGEDMHGYDDGYELAAPVGSFPPSRDGLFDLAGNVQQWTQDWYRPDMQSPESPDDDKNDDGKTYRAVIGSSWGTSRKSWLRSDQLRAAIPRGRDNDIGFRCVLEIRSPAKKMNPPP